MLPDVVMERALERRRRIVFPEGGDERVLKAAFVLAERKWADVLLLGDPDRTATRLKAMGGVISGIEIADPKSPTELDTYATAFAARRKARGKEVSEKDALEVARNPLVQACLKVAAGKADGTVAGAITTTTDVVKAALTCIGPAKGIKHVSSFFLMTGNEAHHSVKDTLIFADCGLVIEPAAEELASIALASAKSREALIGDTPRIAMLSFSTKGSASHPSLDKIKTAIEMIRDARPDLEVDGEFQFDAAFDDAIRASKAPDSVLTGRANIFVFPNLAAGNIAYKIAQRIGGLQAIGPILQGLERPANDVSRGCSSEDIIGVALVTCAQAV